MNKKTKMNITEKDLPPLNAEYWGVIDQFALSFDGYEQWGSFEKCAQLSDLSGKKGFAKLTDRLTYLLVFRTKEMATFW